jgi:mannosyltransferase OCH1-like enzyme
MIPKTIHYCWLSGDPHPEKIELCIESWKKHLPDYQVILWDCNRIDINSNLWLKQAYENKKYAFASDYIRFYALYNYGGIYLDSDVEAVKSFNDILHRQYFLGEEVTGDIEAAVIGAEKGLAWVKECLDHYENRGFIKPNGQFDMSPVPLLVSKIAQKHNLEVSPFDFFSANNYQIGKLMVSENTYCIHHLVGKWFRKGLKHKIKMSVHRLIYFILGRTWHNRLTGVIRKLIGK